MEMTRYYKIFALDTNGAPVEIFRDGTVGPRVHGGGVRHRSALNVLLLRANTVDHENPIEGVEIGTAEIIGSLQYDPTRN